MNGTRGIINSGSSFIIAFAVAAGAGGVVVHVAGLPAPEVGNIGEGGPAAEAALNNAEDVAVAPNGDIYVADRNTQRLLRISDGILTVAHRGDFGAGENDFSGVAVASDGTVVFPTGREVLSLSPDGTISELLAADDTDQAWGPKVAIGPDDAIYLAGGRLPFLVRVDPGGITTPVGGAEEAATEPGAGDGGPAIEARFGSISDLAIDSEGVMYIADEAFGDVRRIGLDGVVTTVFGGGTIPVQDAVDGTAAADVAYGSAEIGVAVDGSGRLYVVPRLTGIVYRIEGGAITRQVGGGPNPGTGFAPLDTQLQAPFRIAVTDKDDLLILVEDGRFLFLAPGTATGLLIASVPSPAGINLDPVVIAASVALAAGMLLLVPFPAEIFNNTLVEHHDQIRAWFRRKGESEGGEFWQRPLGLAAGIVIMALLYGFLDPGFGINGASLTTFTGLLIGVLITTIGLAIPTLIMRRSRTGEWGRLRALPIALLVGVACVVISRLVGFLPGYLYGVVLGLMFAREIGEDEEAREVTAGSVVLLGVALAAWVGLGAVRAAGDGTLTEVIEAALAMTTVATFEALVFGLLPIHGMPGRVLFEHRRSLWAAIWGVSLLAFFHVLVNPQSGYLVDTALVPVATTYALFALFTLASVILWAWFRNRDRQVSGAGSGPRPGRGSE